MNDYMVRILSRNMRIRGIACVTNNLSRKASTQQETSALGSTLLSRALTAGALLGGLIKQKERIGLKIEGNGSVKKILVETDGFGSIRGYIANPKIEPDFENPKFSMGNALGDTGLLTVIKDLGLKNPYSGTVHLISGEIGKDLTYYFMESEQTPSSVGISSNIDARGRPNHCGGFLIQSLPPSKVKSLSNNEPNIESIISKIETFSLKDFLDLGKTPEELLEFMFSEVPYDILQITELNFSCKCSKTYLKNVLLTLGKTELHNLVVQGTAEIVCEYCKKKYVFLKNELQEIYHCLS